jgi:ABC-2 type transport system permease protein
MLLVAGRELGAYTTSLFGWVIMAVILFADGVLFNAIAMRGERPSSEVVRLFFHFSAIVTMVAAVLLAMRTFAAEREQQTLVLLRTSPIRDWSLVAGKFLGAYVLLLVLIGLTLYMPLLVMVNGQVEWGQVLAGYLGLALLGMASTAVGIFGSVLSSNQVLAAVVGGVLMVFLVFSYFLVEATNPPLKEVFGYLGLFNRHFVPFMDGEVHTRTLCFYPSVAFVFLLTSVRVLEARRWR